MRPPLGPIELELRAAGDDLLLVVEVVDEHLPQRERPRDAVDQRDHVHPERALQRRVLEELVQDDLGDGVALELDRDAGAAAVGVVVDVGDLGDHLLVHEVGDLLDQAVVAVALHLIRHLGDDERVAAAAQLLVVHLGAHDHPPTAGCIGLGDGLLRLDQHAAGRKIGTGDMGDQLGRAARRVLDQVQ